MGWVILLLIVLGVGGKCGYDFWYSQQPEVKKKAEQDRKNGELTGVRLRRVQQEMALAVKRQELVHLEEEIEVLRNRETKLVKE